MSPVLFRFLPPLVVVERIGMDRPMKRRRSNRANGPEGSRISQGAARIRVASTTLRRLRKMVETNRIRPDGRLPSERELARRLGVSRSTIREALRALESLGAVRILPSVGAFRVEPRAGERPESRPEDLRDAWEEQRQLVEVRLLLEPQVAALAARRATEEDIDELQRILDEQEDRLSESQEGSAADRRFHEGLSRATGNDALIRTVAELEAAVESYRLRVWQQPEQLASSLRGHRQILAAVARRDAASAARGMDTHIRSCLERLFDASPPPDSQIHAAGRA